jgi:hypothetical protein
MYGSMVRELINWLTFVVLVFLDHKDILKVALSFQALNTLCSMQSLWKRFCFEQVSPHFSTIRREFFSTSPISSDFKELYKVMNNKVCVDCRNFCGEDVYKLHRCYFTDKVVCDDCINKDHYKTITKTEIKKKYKLLSDADLSFMRCFKKSNPFHRSTPMYKFLIAQVEYVIHLKNIQSVRSALQSLMEEERRGMDEKLPEVLAAELDNELITDWMDNELRENNTLADHIRNTDLSVKKAITSIASDFRKYRDAKL